MAPQVVENRGVLAVRSERLVDDGVQEAESLDGGGPGVREQRIGYAVPGAEVGKNIPRVVADNSQAQAALLELRCAALQLDELRATEWSPVSRTDENEHRSARSHDRLQIVCPARLVDEAEVRDALAHLRTELRHVDPLARLLLRSQLEQTEQGEDGQDHRMSHYVVLESLGYPTSVPAIRVSPNGSFAL